MCSKIYDNNQPFFYCSLCDYNLCQFCSNMQNVSMEKMINPQNFENNKKLGNNQEFKLVLIYDNIRKEENFKLGTKIFDVFEKFGTLFKEPTWKSDFIFLCNGKSIDCNDETIENIFPNNLENIIYIHKKDL